MCLAAVLFPETLTGELTGDVKSESSATEASIEDLTAVGPVS